MEVIEMKYRELYRTAQQMVQYAYAPYSRFKVGAALLTKSGEVFTGVNVENSSFGATICAERTAFVKAVSEGFREFDAIAVVSSDGEVFPCGICRQFMFEFGDDLKIITGEDEEHLKIKEITELLPEGFRL
jgi:cytidine deaminase